MHGTTTFQKVAQICYTEKRTVLLGFQKGKWVPCPKGPAGVQQQACRTLGFASWPFAGDEGSLRSSQHEGVYG